MQTADSQVSSIGLYLTPTQIDVIPTNLNWSQPKTHMHTRVCSNNIIVCVLCVCVCRYRSDAGCVARSTDAADAAYQFIIYISAGTDGQRILV